MPVAGSHNTSLVVLSILIATIASYTALDLAGRIRATSGRARYAWLTTAAAAMGGGIWSMHFIAMLAFSMAMPVGYDVVPTVLSLALAVVVTGVGFFVVSRPGSGLAAIALSGLFMGLGIVTMHYTGMAAMRMPADVSYDSVFAVLSVVIAIGASTVALWIAFRNTGLVERVAAAIAMGLAISGMHYTGMRAAIFTPLAALDGAHSHAEIDQLGLALAVAAATLLILFLALLAAMFDRRFAVMAEREGLALRESEERFRTLYRRTPLPLHSIDPTGLVEQVSDAWLQLLGYDREEVIGRPLSDFMTGESAHRHRQTDWPALLRDEEFRNVEYRLVSRSGSILDVLLSARLQRNTQGDFVRVLGGLLDVTARKHIEDALRQAQKTEAIGQLTGGVAHDFNNLLAVVLGNLELLRKRLPSDPKATQLVDNALQGVQRGAALTQRMLAFARRQELRPEPVDVLDLVRGMSDLLQRSIGPMIRIETHFPIHLPRALVDSNQLELALLNLAVNARDAMPTGGALILGARQETVAAHNESGLVPGTYVCLRVQDAGAGMDEPTLARATEPFFTTKGPGKGTGLGLPMVHGLAVQSGGQFVLKSRKGEGTTAEIWLPAVGTSVQDTTEFPAAEPVEPGIRTPLRSLTVLAVDDDALVLMGTAAMLEDLGHKVLEALSGTRALEMLRSNQEIDLVVTDQAMPGMTGLQLASAIKAEWPNLPIILATGYAEVSPDSGPALPRLGKPFSQGALAKAIAEAAAEAEATARVVPFRQRQGA